MILKREQSDNFCPFCNRPGCTSGHLLCTNSNLCFFATQCWQTILTKGSQFLCTGLNFCCLYLPWIIMRYSHTISLTVDLWDINDLSVLKKYFYLYEMYLLATLNFFMLSNFFTNNNKNMSTIDLKIMSTDQDYDIIHFRPFKRPTIQTTISFYGPLCMEGSTGWTLLF